MNLSGESVVEILNFYKTPLSNLIVIYDDIDIEFGRIRIRPEGSSGTHNGMRNISDMLDSHNFPRIRVGTGRPPENMNLADYVLMSFNEEEKKVVENVTNMAAEAVIEMIENGVNQAMCIYN
jgi:PTH1 family peptidyl-tRNA hydrolase